MRLPFKLLPLALLAGCATAPTYLSQHEIAGSYGPYAFKPVSALIDRIGAPTRSMQVGTQTIYVWHGTATWRGRIPVTSVRHGVLTTGNAMDGPPLQYNEVSTSYREESSALSCDLEVYTDSAGIVQNVMVRGQNGACQQFML